MALHVESGLESGSRDISSSPQNLQFQKEKARPISPTLPHTPTKQMRTTSWETQNQYLPCRNTLRSWGVAWHRLKWQGSSAASASCTSRERLDCQGSPEDSTEEKNVKKLKLGRLTLYLLWLPTRMGPTYHSTLNLLKALASLTGHTEWTLRRGKSVNCSGCLL